MGANDDREMLDAAKAECVRLERENAKLQTDLDARFEDSDHQSAKYYRRMRDAERDGDKLRGEIDNYHRILQMQGALLTGAVNALRGDPPALTIWSHHDVAELAAAKVAALAEAQATIEKVREWRDENQEHEVFEATDDEPEECTDECDWCVLDAILSAPSSTGGGDHE